MSHKPIPLFGAAGSEVETEIPDGIAGCGTALPDAPLPRISPSERCTEPWGSAGAQDRAPSGYGSPSPVSDAVRSLQRVGREQRFLAQAGEALAASLDYRETLHTVAHIAAGSIADLCIVDVVRDDGSLERVAYEDAIETGRGAGDDLLQAPMGAAVPGVISEALRTHEVRVMPQVDGPDDEGFLDSLRRLGITSLIVAPMVIRGRPLGVILLGSRDAGKPYGRRAGELAEEIARRAAMAVENARLYEEAQRAIRARDEMLSVVAHDLRNPLGVISMTTELIQDLGATDPQRTAERLQMIRRSANQMNRLIQDLLDVGQLEAGRLHLEAGVEDPVEVMAEATTMLAPLARRASIDLVNDADVGVPPVAMDRGRVLQVLGNLMGNAIKHTAAGGMIRVRVESGDGEVIFSIQDTGVGIAADDLPHLFDRYWQAKDARRGGVGLGLAIAKGLVELHGGRIWVESQPGRGSTFRFALPK